MTVVYYIGDTGACRVEIGPNTEKQKADDLLLKMGFRECTREEWQAKRREQQRMERKEGASDMKTCTCGHCRTAHTTEQGCMVNIKTGKLDLDIGDDTCRCVMVYLPNGTPDGYVGDHDGEFNE